MPASGTVATNGSSMSARMAVQPSANRDGGTRGTSLG